MSTRSLHSLRLSEREPAVHGAVMVQCRLPATASELERVRRCVDDAAAEFGLGRRDRHQFVFAVNEAVTNAIRHGRPDRDGTIGLRIEADGDTLICSVSDSGEFSVAPTDFDPLPEHGRGLTSMALMTDQLELSTAADGTTVRLHKRRRNRQAESSA